MVLKLHRGQVSILKNINRQNSVNDVGEIKVPVLCILSDDAYICTKFRENILYDFKWFKVKNYRPDMTSLQKYIKGK